MYFRMIGVYLIFLDEIVLGNLYGIEESGVMGEFGMEGIMGEDW